MYANIILMLKIIILLLILFLFIGCASSPNLIQSDAPKSIKKKSNALDMPRYYRERF